MSILHQFSTSLTADNAYQSALPLVAYHDGMLFMGEALYGLLRCDFATPAAKVFLLAEDVQALGLSDQLKQFTQIDYAQFVTLTLEYDKVISW